MRAPLLFLPGLVVVALYALARPILFDGYGLVIFFAYGFVVGGALAAWANLRYGEPKPNAWQALLFKPQTIKQKALFFYIVLFTWVYTAYNDIKYLGVAANAIPLLDNLASFEYALSYVWTAACGAIAGFILAWISIRDREKVFFIFSLSVVPLHFFYTVFLIFVLPVEAWELRQMAAWWAISLFLLYVFLTAKFFINRFRRARAAASK